jgi:glucose/arabinose dehydrogenase
MEAQMTSVKQLLPDMMDIGGAPITLAFAPDGTAYYGERLTGNLWEYKGGKYRMVCHLPIPVITDHHETGLLGIALDPKFKRNHYIYAFHSYGDEEKGIKNRVIRMRADGSGNETILDNLPGGRLHNGGIIAFGPDGNLYIGVGIGNEVMEKSQDLKYLGGKVLRVKTDGLIPDDNPFPDSCVYSYGHRNVFGLAFHPKTGKLYISDVGPEKNDEINIIEPDGNYGWPLFTGKVNIKGFIDPITTYTPTITPTQSVFVDGVLYFGSYNEGSVHKLTLGGKDFDEVLADDIVYQGKSFGVVGVFYGPDKHFYVTTPTKILKIEPKA